MRLRPASVPIMTNMGMNSPNSALRAGERNMSAIAVSGITASW
jgi:hypothetical protein